MDRHTYSLDVINGINDGIAAMISYTENAVLSTESMTYSWNTGIVNTIVQWIEVCQINQLKSTILDFFAKAERNFTESRLEIKKIDSISSTSVNDCAKKISEELETIDMLLSFLDETVPVPYFK